MLGVSFLTQAIRQARRTDRISRARVDLTEQLGRGLPAEGELADEHRAILFELAELIANEAWQPSAITCPECGEPDVTLEVQGVEIDYCLVCRGFWFDHDELKSLTGALRDVPANDLRSRASRLECPRCQHGMREYQFHRLHNLMVDLCPTCHGVYLQDQELERSMGIEGRH